MAQSGRRNVQEVENPAMQVDQPPNPPSPINEFIASLPLVHLIFSGMATLINLVENDRIDFRTLVIAYIKLSVADAGLNTAISLPPGVTFSRNNNMEIISIQDGQTRLAGVGVQKLIGAMNCKHQGAKSVIFMTPTNPASPLKAMIIPYSEIEVRTATEIDGSVLTWTYVVTPKGYHQLYLTKPEVLSVLRFPTITMEGVPKVLATLNGVKLNDGGFDVSQFGTLQLATARLAAPNVPEKERQLMRTLIAAFLGSSTMESKVQAFVAHPSFNFFNTLKLPRVWSRDLYSAGNSTMVAKVNLSQLDPTALVVCQQVPADQAYYDRTLAPGMMVYLAGQYKTKTNNNKFKMLQGGSTITVAHLRSIIQAKETRNQAQVAPPAQAAAPNPQPEEGIQVLENLF